MTFEALQKFLKENGLAPATEQLQGLRQWLAQSRLAYRYVPRGLDEIVVSLTIDRQALWAKLVALHTHSLNASISASGAESLPGVGSTLQVGDSFGPPAAATGFNSKLSVETSSLEGLLGQLKKSIIHKKLSTLNEVLGCRG